MAFSVFPAPTTSSAATQFVTAASANTLYDAAVDLSAGVYEITCVSTTITYFTLLGPSGVVTKSQTSSGTVTVVLASDVNRALFWTNTGTNVSIGFTLTGLDLPTSGLSGTLDTITTTGNYNTLGTAWVYGIAGGSGGVTSNSVDVGGSGGRGGGLIEAQVVYINAPVAVTIGAGGAASTAGGSTSFGNLTATANFNSGGSASAANGGGGSMYQTASNGTVSGNTFAKPVFWATAGNGGGGGGSANGVPGVGAAGGLGRGGNGGLKASSTAGNSGTGYGAGGGGGGGGGATSPGGSGSQGVVYVLRFT